MTASLAVEMRDDFRLSDSTLGAAVAISFGVAMVLSPLAGRVVDRGGPERGVYVSASIAAVALLAISLGARSAAVLIVILALAGVGSAFAGPAASALISHRMADQRHGVTFGIQQAGVPAGALLAGAALPLVAIPVGWRWAFAVAAVLPVAVINLMRAVGRVDPPAQRGHERDIRRRVIYLLALAAALANVAANGMVAFLVVYAVGEGVSPPVAGVLLAGTSFAAIVSRIGLGLLADAHGGNIFTRVAVILALGALGYPLLATGQPPALVAGAIVAAGLGWGWTGLMMLAVVQANPKAPGAAIGVALIGVYAGASLGPFLIGIIATAASFAVAWLVGGALVLAAAGVALSANLVDEAME